MSMLMLLCRVLWDDRHKSVIWHLRWILLWAGSLAWGFRWLFDNWVA